MLLKYVKNKIKGGLTAFLLIDLVISGYLGYRQFKNKRPFYAK